MTGSGQAGLLGQIGRFFTGPGDERRRRREAHLLYVALVEQARSPVFYRDWGVPDTQDGRFEMILLHVALVLRRLSTEGPEGGELSRHVLETLVSDMDRNLREMGVGDLSVGKHIQRFSETLFARIAALDPALKADDAGAIGAVVSRNLSDAPNLREARLGAYAITQLNAIRALPADAVLAGDILFAPIET